MIALLSLCSLLALGAAAEEVYNAMRRALACRRIRKASTWHAYRPGARFIFAARRSR